MEHLRNFRADKGLSQEGVARAMGITLSYYAQVERGRVRASMSFMQKLKKIFPDISIDKVFFSEMDTSCSTGGILQGKLGKGV